MNYTLKQLQEQVNRLIEKQGEDAHCAAWIYTKQDCYLEDDLMNQTYPCDCLLYTSPSPRDQRGSRMPSSA